MELNDNTLSAAFPRLKPATRSMILEASTPAIERYEINTTRRLACWLAQCYHESAGFTARVENLNYSAAGLLATWPKRFTKTTATLYARQPEKIANRVYAGRNGCGDEASGHGWLTRGRGFIQLTGMDNYKAFAKALGMTLEEVIAYLETDQGGFDAAAWFFTHNGLWSLCDGWELTKLTKRINGGVHGLDARKALCNGALRAFK
ncbi:putative chitinase [Novosphingobium chloroacetimidivorans]|uniref:Putative chitinase n=1 Tax=Novosphingobium chloroacetimidivorans TaxID=1428314 RepID=A0A7W7NXQ4_9SPHN|nr:glycoside hydrolase family 19 protein [Novosphingobium chloroacetimidivorans]MBB4859445.1 putative chitinase [Novosphingobium chloroacetimidivorans]